MKYRVYIAIETTVEGENPHEAATNVYTIVKNQLSKIPREAFEWRLTSLVGDEVRKPCRA